MSENKDNKLTLINEKTANDYLTHTVQAICLKNSSGEGIMIQLIGEKDYDRN